jgi:hypothetical protein
MNCNVNDDQAFLLVRDLATIELDLSTVATRLNTVRVA